MNTQAYTTRDVGAGRSTTAAAGPAERMAVAFGISAAVTVLSNTALAWIKDAYEPLNALMTALTGHHWWTHGLFDLVLFFVLGWILMARGRSEQHLTGRLVVQLAGAAILAGIGLAGWFFFI